MALKKVQLGHNWLELEETMGKKLGKNRHQKSPKSVQEDARVNFGRYFKNPSNFSPPYGCVKSKRVQSTDKRYLRPHVPF